MNLHPSSLALYFLDIDYMLLWYNKSYRFYTTRCLICFSLDSVIKVSWNIVIDFYFYIQLVIFLYCAWYGFFIMSFVCFISCLVYFYSVLGIILYWALYVFLYRALYGFILSLVNFYIVLGMFLYFSWYVLHCALYAFILCLVCFWCSVWYVSKLCLV